MTALAYFPNVEIEPGIYFASEPIMFGENMWRVIVTDSAFGGRRFAYQWHPVGHLPVWQEQGRWPWFDRDKQDLGLPASLAKLYLANEIAIKEAMIGFTL